MQVVLGDSTGLDLFLEREGLLGLDQVSRAETSFHLPGDI